MKRRRRSCSYILPLLLAAGCDPDVAPADASDRSAPPASVALPSEPDLVAPTVSLVWQGVETASDLLQRADTGLTLLVTNTGDHPAVVTVDTVIYASGRRFIVGSATFELEAGGEARHVVHADTPGIDWDRVLSPAHLFAVAEVLNPTTGAVREFAYSQPVFFHRERGAALFYGKQVLHDRFAKGDLRGQTTAHRDPSVIAVIDATAGQEIAEISDEVQP